MYKDDFYCAYAKVLFLVLLQNMSYRGILIVHKVDGLLRRYRIQKKHISTACLDEKCFLFKYKCIHNSGYT